MPDAHFVYKRFSGDTRKKNIKFTRLRYIEDLKFWKMHFFWFILLQNSNIIEFLWIVLELYKVCFVVFLYLFCFTQKVKIRNDINTLLHKIIKTLFFFWNLNINICILKLLPFSYCDRVLLERYIVHFVFGINQVVFILRTNLVI